MKKIILLILVLASCKTGEKLNNSELCGVLSNLHLQDQFYRGMQELEDPFFMVLDSLMDVNNLSRSEYAKLSEKEQLAFGKIARKIADTKPKISKVEEDSLMVLQKELDYKTTEKLLEIVKKYGFPDTEKLKCENYAAPFLIFGHAPKKYWKEIDKVIEKEKLANRIGEGDYKYIKWHIGGRKDNEIDQIQIQVN
ncbi:hypothetical protein IMCC3317_40780 [Kordia antarctica]|uniref:Uncharacterized protein n=1 Tax=Kordia antarctica TaxID=1218801 RepID=A0A7L4ZSC8_9FLAO|nr:hypothetical protein [Kordia antarctica]QHI38684.1 hypothetical protein IMCC3317_40780 [Kordia antarctica]